MYYRWLACVALLAVAGCSGAAGQARRDAGAGRSSGVAVSTATVQHISIQRTVDLAGTLISPDQAKVSAEAPGVVESPAKLDLAMIFATGFPPFRGGLLKYADTRGLAAIVSDLSRFEKALGPRFTPAPNLALLAQKGETFHKES